ncbi:hypothetical protein EHI8A_014460 [Entamoeba histolytica HM-1:IMSS-B]|uniref:BRCT domain-containing protein n=6 Tax=Entamoeba histolytica TaxID=5759 RepID=C4M600_ENTH1|nr:hypothetical protein EHI_181280 [Entamoeba histolytica HM-1:IMSS]EMD46014.1 Hypothetical protein EHI5A_026330 [Entamoeba histolytica KU27]EMH74258.1 hypothetical protein EHI8A_014460 [Entamoeba histolytica HM-1:IMSS-B]EMS17884.1 hypothetical protein KM1_026290 [Entamoeba histolytica HM-3:IMSS]ENY61701.1 hypothetical protein EHI7A_021070 [Entamoeba histolytica HM-1:IMSS-A]EAL47614.1 hypothetical protein EHI_181280 [Entamoeba histolytica HM-1:IMSS]|eukprot:XP_652998.1 hypothetical protein EHI_181280 [Entamoeba histolytica HM-1:IMSS]
MTIFLEKNQMKSYGPRLFRQKENVFVESEEEKRKQQIVFEYENIIKNIPTSQVELSDMVFEEESIDTESSEKQIYQYNQTEFIIEKNISQIQDKENDYYSCVLEEKPPTKREEKQNQQVVVNQDKISICYPTISASNRRKMNNKLPSLLITNEIQDTSYYFISNRETPPLISLLALAEGLVFVVPRWVYVSRKAGVIKSIKGFEIKKFEKEPTKFGVKRNFLKDKLVYVQPNKDSVIIKKIVKACAGYNVNYSSISDLAIGISQNTLSLKWLRMCIIKNCFIQPSLEDYNN